MVTRTRQVRWVMFVAAVVAVAACGPQEPSTSSLVVHSDCPGLAYSETITSTATPARPRAGSTVRFELGVRRLQQDRGPMQEGRYTFPVPVGVDAVIAVAFADDNPNTWEVRGGALHIVFKAAEGSWLVNDFPRMTILARLSPVLRPGDTVAWKPYRSFEQQFVFAGTLACSVRDPGQVLQAMTVRA